MLLAEQAEQANGGIAWLSLDRSDDDASALLAGLAAAYAPISGHPNPIADVGGFGISACGRATPEVVQMNRTMCLSGDSALGWARWARDSR